MCARVPTLSSPAVPGSLYALAASVSSLAQSLLWAGPPRQYCRARPGRTSGSIKEIAGINRP